MEKISTRWEYGIVVGIRQRSGEVWIATEDGVKTARSVRRIPPEDRWCIDCLTWVKHVPWNRYAGDEGADGEIPEEKKEAGESQPSVIIKTQSVGPREF